MRRRKKWGCLAVILLFTIVAAVFGLHWAWKYYGLPEWPDRREYKTIEERAEKALAFARRHNMNEHYALFVDYGIPSGTPRLCLGLSPKEDSVQHIRHAWAWWWKHSRTSCVQ